LRTEACEPAPLSDDNLPTNKAAKDTAERRQVTVMFSDLVGSTALSARMDPEDLREVISAYQRCVAETVRHFGGFVARYWVMKNLPTGAIYSGSLGSIPATFSGGSGTLSVLNTGTFNNIDGGLAAAMRSNVFLTLNQLLAWANDPWSFWYPNYSPASFPFQGVIASDVLFAQIWL
jgi:hypothetical protein